ncbi:MAG: hypothetical protein J0L64_13555 [Acidobacteria bacterium]|nr:hypothetical protein [Acidobacteriota bacterium]
MGKLTLRFACGVAALACCAWAQSVEIVIATYGSGRLQDVTAVVRAALASGRRELPVTLEALGVSDPAPGRVKSLRVLYRAGDALYEAVAQDFENLALPAGVPDMAASSTQPAAPAPAGSAQPTTGGFFDAPGSASGTAQSAGTPAAAAPAANPPAGSVPAAAAPVAVSPVASVPNGACFYVQANYGGTPYCVASGTSTASLGGQRRRFRSVRLVGSAQAAVLFDADNFLGASVRVLKSQPDLRTAQGPFYSTDFEDRAASVRVE